MAVPFRSNKFIPEGAYETVLGRVFLPDAIIATKPTYASPTWATGEGRSLRHDVWQARTADPQKVCGAHTPVIRMDAHIGYGGVSLLHETAVGDNLTKKVICCAALGTGVIKGPVSATSTYNVSLSSDWVVRWRLGLGIGRNSDLTTDHFDDFVGRLRPGDLTSLIDIRSRLLRLAEDIEAGLADFPSIVECGRSQISWLGMASAMGVPASALSRSARFRVELLSLLPRLAPDIADKVARSLHPMPSEPSKQGSSRTYEELLLPWDYLFRLSQRGLLEHDPLGFSPFEKKLLTKVANEAGRDRQRMRTLEPQDFYVLLVAASKWVLGYADYVIGAVRALEAVRDKALGPDEVQETRARLGRSLSAELPAGCPEVFPNWNRARLAVPPPNALSVGEAAKHLMVACGVVIASFSARRCVEVESLRKGCVSEVAPGVWAVKSYIAKNLRDFEDMPVPGLVAKAAEVLERLTVGTRARTGKSWLFKLDTTVSRQVSFEWSTDLDDFARLMGLPVPKDRDGWDLTFHQFRRGFAVFYYYGERFSSLDALSHMLWHLDPGMTRVYVFEAMRGAMGRLREELVARDRARLQVLSDEEKLQLSEARERLADIEARSASWDDVRCERAAHRLLQAWTGDDRPIGRGTVRLYGDLSAMTHDLAESVRIGPRSNSPDAEVALFMRRAKDWARRNYLEPIPGVPVHCACRPDHQDDLNEAECVKLKRSTPPAVPGASAQTRDSMPDASYASTYVCLGCSHCVAFGEDRRLIREGLDRLADAACRGPTEAVREEAKARHARTDALVQEAEAAVSGHVVERPSWRE